MHWNISVLKQFTNHKNYSIFSIWYRQVSRTLKWILSRNKHTSYILYVRIHSQMATRNPDRYRQFQSIDFPTSWPTTVLRLRRSSSELIKVASLSPNWRFAKLGYLFLFNLICLHVQFHVTNYVCTMRSTQNNLWAARMLKGRTDRKSILNIFLGCISIYFYERAR